MLTTNFINICTICFSCLQYRLESALSAIGFMNNLTYLIFICNHAFIFSYSYSSDLYKILGLQVSLNFIWHFLFNGLIVQSSYEVVILTELMSDATFF
jgi:hypothetical protein